MLTVIIVWLVISLPLVYISRASFKNPGSHGFYRFFAWEAIILLVLLNAAFWFQDPFAWHQLISWLLLVASLYLVIASLIQLHQKGRPRATRQDPALLPLEKTTLLVTSGIYRSIRHPMYSSLLWLAWGIFFKLPSWMGVILAIGATFSLVQTARSEEAENLRYFGPEYQEYMRRTKRFIPRLV